MYFNVHDNVQNLAMKIDKKLWLERINNFISYSFLNLIIFKDYAKLPASYWRWFEVCKDYRLANNNKKELLYSNTQSFSLSFPPFFTFITYATHTHTQSYTGYYAL